MADAFDSASSGSGNSLRDPLLPPDRRPPTPQARIPRDVLNAGPDALETGSTSSREGLNFADLLRPAAGHQALDEDAGTVDLESQRFELDRTDVSGAGYLKNIERQALKNAVSTSAMLDKFLVGESPGATLIDSESFIDRFSRLTSTINEAFIPEVAEEGSASGDIEEGAVDEDIETGPAREDTEAGSVGEDIEEGATAGDIETGALGEDIEEGADPENSEADATSGDIEEGVAREDPSVRSDSQRQSLSEPDQNVAAREKLTKELKQGMADVNRALGKIPDAKQAFWDYKSLQSQSKFQPINQAKRHLMGSERHAVLARAAIQTAMTVYLGSVFQQLTANQLNNFYSADPDRIPSGVLKDARAELIKERGEGAVITKAAVQKRAISDLSKLSSTYFDEATTPKAVVQFGDPAVAGTRSAISAIADSKIEGEKRQGQITKEIDAVLNPQEPKPWRQELAEVYKDVSAKGIPAQLQSGKVAATIGLLGAGPNPGWRDGLEIGKTMLLAYLAGVSNSGVDAARDTFYKGDSEVTSQSLKVIGRVAGREVAQLLKMAISYGDEAIFGDLSKRNPMADFGITVSMTAIASGGMKEVAGAIFQWAGNELLPPDEAAVATMAKAMKPMAELAKTLSKVESEPSIGLDETVVTTAGELLGEIQGFVAELAETAGTSFEDEAFGEMYNSYQHALLEKT